eukprot:1605349-Lingulodinium_polyedra.AAC.1
MGLSQRPLDGRWEDVWKFVLFASQLFLAKPAARGIGRRTTAKTPAARFRRIIARRLDLFWAGDWATLW